MSRKLYREYKSGETTLNNSRTELENQVNIHRTQLQSQRNTYSPAHIRKNSTLSLQKDANVDGKHKIYQLFLHAAF